MERQSSSLLWRTWQESKKSWHIAAPAILTSVFQFSIGFATAVFVGSLGSLQLSAISVSQNVIEGFAFGIMLGMGSALETLCGQAVGAGQFHILGIYLQRSWIITFVTAVALTPLYVFTGPILRLLRQPDDISRIAGEFSVWIIPQLFAYAVNFPLQKFFQAQRKVWVIALICGAVLGVHILLSWLFIAKLGRGLMAAAMVGNFSWWLVNLAQLLYLLSGRFQDSWTGFSFLAFQNLTSFVKISLSSAVMLCLELWYYSAVIILVGYLSNPDVAIAAITICMNYQIWTLMIALGFCIAVSVRVSNELGANRAEAAKFSVIVMVSKSAIVGSIFMAIALSLRKQLPRFFTGDEDVIREASKLGYFLSALILLSSIQPVLTGVAVGAGWQSSVAYINTACYYIFGLPIGALLGFKFKLKEMGIWIGMLAGVVAQTAILLLIVVRTKWHKEAIKAEERVRAWEANARGEQELAHHQL